MSYSIFDKFDTGVQVISQDMRYLYLNQSLLKQINMTLKNLKDKPMEEIFPGIETTDVYLAIKKVLKTQLATEITNEFVFNDGRRTFHQLTLEPTNDGVIIFSKDITDTKQGIVLLQESNNMFEKKVASRTKELNRLMHDYILQRDRAVELEKIKSKFLANMSHDLRTPLSGIVGFLELAIEDIEPHSQVSEFVKHAITSAEHLHQMISDILTYSKLEHNAIELRRTPVALDAFIAPVFQGLMVLAKKKGLALSFENTGKDSIVTIDEMRFKQIIYNLVGNAIKFTQKGNVKMSYHFKPSNQRLYFTVKDTGQGIAQKDLKAIFHDFKRLSNRETLATEGCGLGLAITKRLVELMGGEIHCRSNLGAGSSFRLWIEAGSQTSRQSGAPLSKAS